MSPSGHSETACPFQPAMDTSLMDVAFDQPEHLASMYPTSRGRAEVMPAMQAIARYELVTLGACDPSPPLPLLLIHTSK